MYSLHTRLQFWMELYSNKPGMILNFNNLHKFTIGRGSRKNHTMLFKGLPVSIVELETVPVSLVDKEFAIHLVCLRPLFDNAGVASKAHCSTLLLNFFLLLHQVNDRIARPLVDSVELASASLHTLRANSTEAHCIPRHIPKNGIPCSLA